MKTCQSCRFFVQNDTPSIVENEALGECHAVPPRKSSERGGSYRPQVHEADPACACYSRPMPPAVPLPKAEVIRLEVCAEKEFTRLVERLEAIRFGSKRLNNNPPRQGHWYCWHQQSAVVRDTMRELGLPHGNLRVLSEAVQVAGLSGGTLVDISNHPIQIPDEVLVLMERAGMMRLRLSDEWLRSKAERMMGR